MKANILAEFGSFAVTRFGVWIAAGALAWLWTAQMTRSAKYRKMAPGAVWCAGMCMALCGLACARIVYCAANFDIYFAEGGAREIARVWEGGLSMGGALTGAVAGIAISCRFSGEKAGRLMNCFGPGMALFAACEVMAQRAIGEGWGKLTDQAWLAETILGVRDLYGDVRYAVWRLELIGCAAALLAGLIPLMGRRTARYASWAWSMGTYAAVRIVTASMREGAVLRVEFFRIEQIAGVVFLLAIAVGTLVARKKAGKRIAGKIIVFLIGLAAAIGLEFAVDREGNMEIKYMLMGIGALMCMTGALPNAYIKRAKKEK